MFKIGQKVIITVEECQKINGVPILYNTKNTPAVVKAIGEERIVIQSIADAEEFIYPINKVVFYRNETFKSKVK